jgi:hypothetical protein
MSKIDDNLHIEVLSALAKACGFSVAYDRSPGADTWTLSAGHGDEHLQYVGTRQCVCAFLHGYAAMRLQTTQILNELDNAQRRQILDMRSRLGC